MIMATTKHKSCSSTATVKTCVSGRDDQRDVRVSHICVSVVLHMSCS